MTSQLSILREPPHDPAGECAYRNPPVLRAACLLEQMARAESPGAGADRLRGCICEKAAGDDLPGRRRPFLPLVPRLVLPLSHETETRTGAVR